MSSRRRNNDLQSVRPAELHSEHAGICWGAAVPAVGPPDILSGVCKSAGETPACPADKMSAPQSASALTTSSVQADNAAGYKPAGRTGQRSMFRI